MVGLAKAVHATSIAEGVETAGQHASLRQMGCQLAQGYLWSPAVPLADLDEALAACREVPRPRAARLASRNQLHLALDPAAREAMLALEGSGASLRTVAAALNAQGLQTPHNMRWTAAAVARHLHR